MDIKTALREVIDSLEKGYALPADLKTICQIALVKLERVDELESYVAGVQGLQTQRLNSMTPKEVANVTVYHLLLGRDEFF